MSISILILEDRPSVMDRVSEVFKLIAEEMRVTIDIVECLGVDDAWKNFNKKISWDAIIIDLMVPAGSLFKNSDTSSGLDTGQLFVEKILSEKDIVKKIYIYSARNKGIPRALEENDKVAELPKSEYSNVALAEYVLKEISSD